MILVYSFQHFPKQSAAKEKKAKAGQAQKRTSNPRHQQGPDPAVVQHRALPSPPMEETLEASITLSAEELAQVNEHLAGVGWSEHDPGFQEVLNESIQTAALEAHQRFEEEAAAKKAKVEESGAGLVSSSSTDSTITLSSQSQPSSQEPKPVEKPKPKARSLRDRWVSILPSGTVIISSSQDKKKPVRSKPSSSAKERSEKPKERQEMKGKERKIEKKEEKEDEEEKEDRVEEEVEVADKTKDKRKPGA